MMNDFIIMATRSMRDYASRVVERLNHFIDTRGEGTMTDGVNALEVQRFADGETEAVINTSLRGKQAVLFAGCARNQQGLSVNEAKMELYHTIDAMKRSQAQKIFVFEPFVSCSRSDRTTRRSSVGLWMHLKILSSLGANHIITYQLHSDKSKSMVDPTICALDDIPALPLLKKRLCDTYIRDLETLEGEVRSHWAFCSVDAGGEKLARRFANAFGAPLVLAHKQRDYSRTNSVESIDILSSEPVAGKVLWIVDDMVDTAGSVEQLVHALAPLKPARINLIAVHAILSNPALERLNRLSSQGLLDKIMVTDTVCSSPALPEQLPNLEVVPSAKLSAEVIGTILTNNSIGELLRPFSASAYFRAPSLFNQI
ncbi:MAG: ribose-phosphate diphosphokinase [Spirochaetaceae bacterium]|nr:ribose-phosphate diphosphokinase [Spirochaetaceae bacterium]